MGQFDGPAAVKKGKIPQLHIEQESEWDPEPNWIYIYIFFFLFFLE
jgi:hypothetical protein